jgi:hypothetical protein
MNDEIRMLDYASLIEAKKASAKEAFFILKHLPDKQKELKPECCLNSENIR